MAEVQHVGGNTVTQLITNIWSWVENFISLFWNGLGWPQTTLIVFFVGLYCFKVELKDIIPRIKSIGASGFEVSAKPQKAQGVVQELNTAQLGNVDFPCVFGSMLESVNREILNVPEEGVVDFLRYNNAIWRTMYVFENIYSFIFGGQISLLWMLNPLGDNGMPMADVEREWSLYKERFKPHLDAWDMGPFLQFLYNNELAAESEGVLRVTPKGKEFLVWMTKTGRPSVRPW